MVAETNAQSTSRGVQSGVSSGAVDIPQTNLSPIGGPTFGASAAPFAPNAGSPFAPNTRQSPFAQSQPTSPFTAPSAGPQFDPYAPQRSGGVLGGIGLGSGTSIGGIGPPTFGTPSLTPPSFPPSSGFAAPGAPPVTTIGPPAGIAPTQPGIGGSSFGAIAPSPPGGGLLNRIFSRPASSPMTSGFGPQTGFGQSFGVPNAGASIQMPIITGPIGGYPGGYDNPNVYGPPVTYAPGYGAPPMNGFQNGGLSGGGFSSGIPGAGFSGGGFSGGGGPQFPGSAFPSSGPSTLFPGGIFQGGLFSGFSNKSDFSAYRLLQGPRLRHTYVLGLGGSDPDNLSTNDTDVSVVFAFPNFLYGNQPLYVVPSFSLHQWEGPISTPNSALTGDLPANAYSGFLDVGWQSDPNQMFGTELGVRVGAFTDFNTWNSDSLRILGKALVHFRLSPTSTLKAGAYYLDRNKVKLVPAGGILWQPNPYTRFDIFFPQPKIARYWRTVGTRDVWWYLAGDYGGGSWTVRRRDRSEDSVDINELRAMFGMEWGTTDSIRAGRRSAFMEVGYAFDREVEYRRSPLDDFKPDDGIVFRLGIGY